MLILIYCKKFIWIKFNYFWFFWIWRKKKKKDAHKASHITKEKVEEGKSLYKDYVKAVKEKRSVKYKPLSGKELLSAYKNKYIVL